MANDSWEQMSQAQLRQIVADYLDEVLRCYQEEQCFRLQAVGTGPSRLEQKASELLEAMMISVEASERRKAVLQVLSRAKEYRASS